MQALLELDGQSLDGQSLDENKIRQEENKQEIKRVAKNFANQYGLSFKDPNDQRKQQFFALAMILNCKEKLKV